MSHLSSQPSLTWQRLYNGPQNRDDEANAICKADGNNFYIAGYSFFTTQPTLRPYVIKINQDGDTLWTKIVPVNGGGGVINSLLETADGGCVATGEKSNFKYLLRLDKNGNTVWTYTYSGSAIFYALKRASNGDYICSGVSGNSGASLRIDTLGNLKYDKQYPNLLFQIHSLQTTSDNGCIIAGATVPQQAIIVKLDSAGNTIQTKYFMINNGPSVAFSFERTNTNNFVLSGSFFNGSQSVPYFVTLDNNLNPLDTHIFAQIDEEISLAMRILPNGNYVWIFSEPNNFNRFLITDIYGNIIHEKIKYYNGNLASEGLYDILPLENNDIMFIGFASYMTFDDMYVIRADSSLNFPPNIIGIEPINTSIPASFALYQNYPNPFNPVTKIKFDISRKENVKLKLYDLTGREMAVLLDDELNPGSYLIDWNALNFTSGIYFAVLSTKNYKQTIKMILLK